MNEKQTIVNKIFIYLGDISLKKKKKYFLEDLNLEQTLKRFGQMAWLLRLFANKTIISLYDNICSLPDNI